MNLKKEYSKFTKNNGFISGHWKFICLILYKIIEHIAIWFYKHSFPINKRLILLRSMPDYSDNALALAEYLVNNGYTERYDIFFDVRDPKIFQEKDNKLPITFFSCLNKNGQYNLRSLKLIYTAHYLMCTHTMILNSYQGRKGQHFIRLWHGCGYKDRSTHDGHSRRNFDVALVPGPLFVKTKAYFWNVDEKYIAPIGYPRYDWLMKKDPKALKFIQSFKESENEKIIIWMPTFRVDKKGRYNDTQNLINFPILYNSQDWLQLDKYCKGKYVKIIIKLHPFQKAYDIPFRQMTNIKEITNDDLKIAKTQLYSFIALTDGLITDYSSVAFDYLIVDKPIAYTLDDYKEYKEKRGFIFKDPLKYMPGHHIYTTEDLMHFVEDISNEIDKFKSNRNEIYNIAITPSTNYCKQILDFLNIKK